LLLQILVITVFNPYHSYLAEDEIPLTETGELVFNKNPDKLIRFVGANDIKSSPQVSWNQSKSRRCFSDNNIIGAVVKFIN